MAFGSMLRTSIIFPSKFACQFKDRPSERTIAFSMLLMFQVESRLSEIIPLHISSFTLLEYQRSRRRVCVKTRRRKNPKSGAEQKNSDLDIINRQSRQNRPGEEGDQSVKLWRVKTFFPTNPKLKRILRPSDIELSLRSRLVHKNQSYFRENSSV